MRRRTEGTWLDTWTGSSRWQMMLRPRSFLVLRDAYVGWAFQSFGGRRAGLTGYQLDLFPQKNQQAEAGPAPKARPLADQTTRENAERLGGLPRPWNGSEKYHRIGEIGRGAFATVWKVTSRFDGLPYAAKELDKRKFMKDGVLDQKVENELNIMQRVMHASSDHHSFHCAFADPLTAQHRALHRTYRLGQPTLHHHHGVCPRW